MTPVYKAYYEYVKSVTVTGNCDESCFFSRCIDRHGGVNYTCLNTCGCIINKTAHDKALKNLDKVYNGFEKDMESYGNSILEEFLPTIIKY